MEDDFEWIYQSTDYDEESIKASVLDLIDMEDIKPCTSGKMSISLEDYEGSDPLGMLFSAFVKCDETVQFSCTCDKVTKRVISSKVRKI